jgi:hypothetical protein
MYGGCSIQVFDPFTEAGNLSYTHADANGFLNYVNQFDQIDFHFQDGSVQEWEYDPTYDDWQNLYGMDAVRAFYHSGHGGMQSDGTFFAPLGARWSGKDYAISSSMSLADQSSGTCSGAPAIHSRCSTGSRRYGPGTRSTRACG